MSEKPHEFREDADDYSMCTCGVPADQHWRVSALTTETIRMRFAEAYGNYANGLEDFDRWLAARDGEWTKEVRRDLRGKITHTRKVTGWAAVHDG